ncbi:hypothetical protein TBLA_0G01550 [Henningerozyma blattae CBS 6284]|uniref:Ankyrin repeat-containing protein YAR1 n=1 Tax=Henningerozyma blattae (strain ATCC 34711 / CBS 6284 / DSM 70876 / NBRC 10599 / NRRL Y-10934 / UCD 77-7) TaxID=1071380 RepID=I2H6U7_HENB6|nr:hypothetical protein TBLA_0G01550 [Tetrapisispora blattae CBS 6284]CCH62099.1 hypothetical protein TBLA_0G01550 [Tetrapisispora blattae CBS 6284]
MALYNGKLDQEQQDAIIYNARVGDLETLEEIFTTLIDPKVITTIQESENASTILHILAANGDNDIIKYIISLVRPNTTMEEFEKYINHANKEGNTPLHWASLNGKLETVKLLCDEYEADPFIRNNAGHDSIYEAENNGKEVIENYFLSKYDVEPGSDDDDEVEQQSEASISNVEVNVGTEIESVTKEAAEVLVSQTKDLNLNNESK